MPKSDLFSWILRLLFVVIIGGIGQFISQPVHAQWPPFWFDLTPSPDQSEITYDLTFYSRLPEGMMNNITINIPIPEGTRYLRGNAQPTTEVSFDGQEVKFFTPVLKNRSIRVASFTVEITNPEQEVFTTEPWISWEGRSPGHYLARQRSIDITKPVLEWEDPGWSRLALEAGAIVVDNVITYHIYPTNEGGRMWDLTVKLPVPEGTRFLSADAPEFFATSFDGREVTFSTSELERRREMAPLQVKVSTEAVTEPVVVTHVWASWKNVGWSAGRRIPPQEDIRSGDIVVQPHRWQWVVSDPIGDVPFGDYDVTSVALTAGRDDLEVTFYTFGPLSRGNEPFVFSFYFDIDCAGQDEYKIHYPHHRERAYFQLRDPETGEWADTQRIEFENPGPHFVTFSIPYELFIEPVHSQSFCVDLQGSYNTDQFQSRPPGERAPGTNNERWVRYQRVSEESQSFSIVDQQAASTASTASEPDPGQETSLAVASVEAREPLPALRGKIAVPVDNGRDSYDVYIYSVPEGQEIDWIPSARQPNFRFDGQRLVVNREGRGVENVFEYNFEDKQSVRVSDAPRDVHPFYDGWGNRVVYGNSELTVGSREPERNQNNEIVRDQDGDIVYQGAPRKPFIFVQCSLVPPHLENDPLCRDLPGQGMLIPAGQMSEIQGTHPVWTANDRIVYKGCNTWAGSDLCGIYSVPSASTRGQSDGFIPLQLTRESTDIPSDSKRHLIAFTSQRDGDWEAYLMNLDGSNERNISNSPSSNDGLPTISPGGEWIAFVSDRDGSWAVWITPTSGGEITKLVDLPSDKPWGEKDRAWLSERISWGGTPADQPYLISAFDSSTPDYYALYPPPEPATPPPSTAATPPPSPENAVSSQPDDPIASVVTDDQAIIIGEVGQIDKLYNSPRTIRFKQTYQNPVVFAQPLSYRGYDVAVVRITDIQTNSFTLYVQEAPNLDANHTGESVSYLVLEAGAWQLAEGQLLEVGKISTNWTYVTFAAPFETTPVIFSQVQSTNDTAWVKTRQRNSSVAGFDLLLTAEEARSNFPAPEQIGWWAMTPGQGFWSDYRYEVKQAEEIVTHQWTDLNFQQEFESAPYFLANLATFNEADSSHLRLQSIDGTAATMRIEEDMTLDAEMEHAPEAVSYFALEGAGFLTAVPVNR